MIRLTSWFEIDEKEYMWYIIQGYDIKIFSHQGIDSRIRWILNGKIHREDGPAVIYRNGGQFWYLNNKPHREDGPAFTHPNGNNKWYLNDLEYSEEEFKHKNNI